MTEANIAIAVSLEEIPTHFQIIAKLIVPDSQDVGLTCHLLNLLSPSQYSVTKILFWSELDHVFNVLILCHRWHKIHIVEDCIYCQLERRPKTGPGPSRATVEELLWINKSLLLPSSLPLTPSR